MRRRVDLAAWSRAVDRQVRRGLRRRRGGREEGGGGAALRLALRRAEPDLLDRLRERAAEQRERGEPGLEHLPEPLGVAPIAALREPAEEPRRRDGRDGAEQRVRLALERGEERGVPGAARPEGREDAPALVGADLGAPPQLGGLRREGGVVAAGERGDEARAELVRRNPQGRLMLPQEVANAVLWLCLPGSEAITGQAISVSGGEVM